MDAKLTYVIEFVADMDRAVKFYRDAIGLSLKFQSPGWSEFSTGETTLALHPASEKNPPGKVELGFGVPNFSNSTTSCRGRVLLSPCRPKSRTSAACWPSSSTPKAPTSASAAASRCSLKSRCSGSARCPDSPGSPGFSSTREPSGQKSPYRINVRGRSTHSGRPSGCRNANVWSPRVILRAIIAACPSHVTVDPATETLSPT